MIQTVKTETNAPLISDDKLIDFGMRYDWLYIDRFCFSKSKKEKQELKRERNAHNKRIREAGFNPKKRMNLSLPQTMKS